jgi:hypothetical protein
MCSGNNRAQGKHLKICREYLKNITVKQNIKKIQKTATLDTARVHRKVIMSKCKRCLLVNTIQTTVHRSRRTAVKLYALETCFVSGIKLCMHCINIIIIIIITYNNFPVLHPLLVLCSQFLPVSQVLCVRFFCFLAYLTFPT